MSAVSKNHPQEHVNAVESSAAQLAARSGIYELLSPQNSALVLIDHQPQMAFGVQSIDRHLLLNNVIALAKSGAVFNIPAVLTSIAEKNFSGPIFPEVKEVFPNLPTIDRTSMNAWEDPKFREAVTKTRRKKIVAAALWTEVCLALPVIGMLREGYEMYIVTNASGGTSVEAHQMAIQRMIQAGAVPVTWMQVLLEWQRDWARDETYDATTEVIRKHGGAYGMGINYARSMLGGHADLGTAEK